MAGEVLLGTGSVEGKHPGEGAFPATPSLAVQADGGLAGHASLCIAVREGMVMKYYYTDLGGKAGQPGWAASVGSLYRGIPMAKCPG